MASQTPNPSVTTPKPAYRIFISSTFVDMIPYRDAIAEAIRNCDAVAYGMERFVPAPIRPLDRCYEEIDESQIFILLLGHRYGEIDSDSGKSYTELEYIHAKERGLPILAFMLDTDKIGTPEKFRESDAQFQALRRFKMTLKLSKEITVATFDSEKSLQEMATRAINDTKGRMEKAHKTVNDYSAGANLYKKFVKRPVHYKGQDAVLRVRMDGKFGDARLREALYEAFGMPIGDAIYLNDLFVLGTSIDVSYDGWLIDAFAEGNAADWLDENNVTTGTVFEAKFRFAYEIVKKGGAARGELPHDAYQAKLIMLKGIRVIETESLDVTANSRKKVSASPVETDLDENSETIEMFRQTLAQMIQGFHTSSADGMNGDVN